MNILIICILLVLLFSLILWKVFRPISTMDFDFTRDNEFLLEIIEELESKGGLRLKIKRKKEERNRKSFLKKVG